MAFSGGGDSEGSRGVSLRRLPNDLPEPNCRTERPSVYIPLGHNKMKQHIKAVFYEHVANFKKSSNKSTKNKNMEWKVRLESKREKEAMKAGFAGRVNDAGQSSKKRRRNGRDTDYPPDLEKKKKMKVQDVQKSRQDAIEAYRRLKAVKQQKQQLVRSQAKKAKGGNKWRS